MNTEKLVALLETHIKDITDMNELLSRRLANFADTSDLRNLQKLVMERELQEWNKNVEMEVQLMDLKLPIAVHYSAVPYKIKSIILKSNDLKKPFRPFNTLDFLLSLNTEIKSENDDLPERVKELSTFKIEPFLIQNSIAKYLQSLIHHYFDLNTSRNDENAVRHIFKILQAEAKKFVVNTTSLLEKPQNKDLECQFHTNFKKYILDFIAIELETPEQA